MSRQTVEYILLDAKGATGAGLAIPCEDFRHAIFSFATDGGSDADLTVKFQGAISSDSGEDAPDFGSAATVDNMWDYIEVVDLEDGTEIDGDTGVSVSGADDYRLLEANINGLKYLCARVTARAEGECTVRVRLFND